LLSLALSLSPGIFLWLAWPPLSFTGFLFIGFVPLLLLEDWFIRQPKSSFRLYFAYTYAGLLAWNALTTYWVMYAITYSARK